MVRRLGLLQVRNKYAADPLTYEASAFLYSSCKASSFDGCYNPPLRWATGETMELSNCFFDIPGCLKQLARDLPRTLR